MSTLPASFVRVLLAVFASGAFLVSCATVPDPVLTKDRDDALERARIAELSLAEVRLALQDAERVLGDLQGQIRAIQDSKGQLSAESQEQLRKINEKLGLIAGLEAEQSSLSRELERARASIQSLQETARANSAEFRATIDRLDSDNQAKNARNEKLAQEIQDTRSALARKARELETLQETHDRNLSSLSLGKTELEQLVQKQNNEIKNLKEGLYQSQLEKNRLADELALDRARIRAASETLQRSLAKEIASGDIEIRQMDNVLILNMRDSIIFSPDRADLNPRYTSVLGRMAAVFKDLPEKNIRVEGHTAVGVSSPETLRRYPTSWDLGAARAISVLRYFREQAGIDGSRLVATSFGEYRPIAANDTEVSKQANRRVRIVLVNSPVYENP